MPVGDAVAMQYRSEGMQRLAVLDLRHCVVPARPQRTVVMMHVLHDACGDEACAGHTCCMSHPSRGMFQSGEAPEALEIKLCKLLA